MGPTLLSFVNENKPFAPDFGLFEIGRVCEGVKEDGLCNERKKLGIALYSRTRSEKELYMELLEIFTALGRDIKRADFTFKNGEPRHGWQHPRNTAFVSYQGQELGWLCALPSRGGCQAGQKSRRGLRAAGYGRLRRHPGDGHCLSGALPLPRH